MLKNALGEQALNKSSLLLSPDAPSQAVAESPPTAGFYEDMMEEMEKLVPFQPGSLLISFGTTHTTRLCITLGAF